jgi:hypothetical protein
MVLYLDAGISNSYPGTGTTWYDLSGNGNHGTFAGNTSFSTHFGGAMLFDGSNSAITFNNPVNIPIGNEPYTISVWFNSNQMPSDRGFVGWGNFGNVNQVNAWRLRDSGVSGFRHYWWGNDLDYQTPMSTGVWYHAVAAYENGSRKLYLNNVKVAEDYPTGHNVPFATNLRIGVTADFLGEWFDGQIAQVVIYKRQATEAEISIMYQSGLTRFNTYLNGMYVNQFASILGNTAAELALTNFITSKGMNDLTFYMGSLLSTSQNRTYMRSFITQLHSLGQNYWSAGFRVFSNVTQASGCIDTNNPGTEASYNIGCSFNGEKFDGFTQEWEFWNNNPYGDFTTFTVDDIQIYNYCQANGMKYDIYLSKCEDYAALVPDSVIATHIVTYHDTVHLVAYISESTYNSNKGLSAARKAQLELLGYAAIAANKVQEFTILWASYGNSGVNMRDWFVSHPTLLAYVGFESEYNAWVSPAKAGLKFMGQKIYAYSGIFDL